MKLLIIISYLISIVSSVTVGIYYKNSVSFRERTELELKNQQLFYDSTKSVNEILLLINKRVAYNSELPDSNFVKNYLSHKIDNSKYLSLLHRNDTRFKPMHTTVSGIDSMINLVQKYQKDLYKKIDLSQGIVVCYPLKDKYSVLSTDYLNALKSYGYKNVTSRPNYPPLTSKMMYGRGYSVTSDDIDPSKIQVLIAYSNSPLVDNSNKVYEKYDYKKLSKDSLVFIHAKNQKVINDIISKIDKMHSVQSNMAYQDGKLVHVETTPMIMLTIPQQFNDRILYADLYNELGKKYLLFTELNQVPRNYMTQLYNVTIKNGLIVVALYNVK